MPNLHSTKVLGDLNVTGKLLAYEIIETSSIKFKENIRPLNFDISKIKELHGVFYDLKNSNTKDEIGLIAEDVYKIIPEVVSLDDDGEVQGIKYQRLTVVLLEVVKELMTEIEELKKEIRK